MKKYKTKHAWLLLVLMLAIAPIVEASIPNTSMAADTYSNSQDMQQVQLLMHKLRGLLSSAKDVDGLEEMGMSKSDARRMRQALKTKISAMASDVISAINRL